MENTYDLRELALLLWSKLRFILLFSFFCAVFAFLIAFFLMPKKYESYTSMYVKNSNEASTIVGNINLNDLNASKSLVDTYAAVLMSDSVMEETEKRLKEQFDEDELQPVFSRLPSLRRLLSDALPFLSSDDEETLGLEKYVTISSVNGTEVMRISAITKKPEVSSAICNIIADIAPEFLIRVVGAGSVEVIDRAKPDNKPTSPNVMMITLVGGFLGLVLSVTIVWMADFFDDTIRDVEQLTQRFEKPLLGEIQRLDSEKKEKKKSKKSDAQMKRWLITDERVAFSAVEGYKSIRTNIMFALTTTKKQIFAISSPNPSDGKSTTAANTALAFAQASKRVLLIDADMRKPIMHRIFHTDNSAGLSTLVAAMSNEEESIRRNVAENMDLLPSGPLPPNPSELLASAQFQTLLEQLRSTYDYIIIDTPPMNMVSDAMVMHDWIGGIVVVVSYSQSTYEDISEVIKRADTSGANVLGFVVNNVLESKSGSYSKYKYKYRYDYNYGYGGHKKQSKDPPKETDSQVAQQVTKSRKTSAPAEK